MYLFLRKRTSLPWETLGLAEGNSGFLQTRELSECQILRIPVDFLSSTPRTLATCSQVGKLENSSLRNVNSQREKDFTEDTEIRNFSTK